MLSLQMRKPRVQTARVTYPQLHGSRRPGGPVGSQSPALSRSVLPLPRAGTSCYFHPFRRFRQKIRYRTHSVKENVKPRACWEPWRCSEAWLAARNAPAVSRSPPRRGHEAVRRSHDSARMIRERLLLSLAFSDQL